MLLTDRPDVARLLFVTQDNKLQDHDITFRDQYLLGRGSDADIYFEDEHVSRRHARVFWSGGKLFLENLSTKQGTLLRGREIEEPTPLADQDRFELGRTQVLYLIGHERETLITDLAHHRVYLK